MNSTPLSPLTNAFLEHGGEMGQHVRSYDWGNSSIGTLESWPQSLKTTLGILLHSKFPMFLWWGPELICFYNDAYRPSLGEHGKHPSILGAGAKEAWPEIWDFLEPLIRIVLRGGSVYREDQYLPIFRNNKIEDVYWTFGYSPVFDEANDVAGVLVTCTETTGKVMAAAARQNSEQRFQNLVRDASVGIVVLSGEDFRIDVVNEAYGKLIGYQVDELLHHLLFDILPDAASYYRPIISKVRSTGEPVYLYDQAYEAVKDSKKTAGYLNIVYQPYREADGTVTGVIVLCQDVTAQVNSRAELERALEQARLSKEAAQLGTFDMDMEKGSMIWDKRCRILFGISHDNEVTYEHDFVEGLHRDDRERITGVIDGLFAGPETNGNYDVEYRTIGIEDHKERWVRAKGKVYYGPEHKPVRFIGSVLDITEQKTDELRKNDFIGMVSHELKTPLTSSTAMVQLLLSKAVSEQDNFKENILRKVNIQLKKMAGMIKGFLDTSRLESGKIVIEKTKFDIKGLLEEALEEAKVTLSSHKIVFTPCSSTTLYADRDKIGSVISNLLSNAVKYAPAIKKVEMHCAVIAQEVVVSVTDHGLGIAKSDIGKLFDRYYRVQNKDTYHIAGFGIGLYLSAEIIKHHGGRLWVESELGKGSTFSFALPVAQDHG